MNFFQLLLPDFSLILCGYLLCRFTALNRPLWQQVESLVYYFLFPVLLFQSIVKSPLDWHAASSLMGAGLGSGLIAIALAYGVAHLPGIRGHVNVRDHAAGAQVAFRFNSFIGLALAERLAGGAGVQQMAVLIGVCVPLFNIAAVWPMARQSQRHFWKELVRNPLIVATLSGLVFNVAGGRLPEALVPTLSRIGAASIALGLMAAGAGLQWSSLTQNKAVSVALLAIRHAITPLVAWGFAIALNLPPLQAQMLLLFSALPTASSAYVLATRMGYNGAYVAGLVTASTLLGVLSLPFGLSLLR